MSISETVFALKYIISWLPVVFPFILLFDAMIWISSSWANYTRKFSCPSYLGVSSVLGVVDPQVSIHGNSENNIDVVNNVYRVNTRFNQTPTFNKTP